MDNNPWLLLSAKGDCFASFRVHFVPETVRAIDAMPEGAPYSATNTPPPFPLSLTSDRPAR